MKTQSLFILLFLVPILLHAQQNAESVVASGFMVGNCNELFVNATIGQLLINGGTCGDFIVSPGFQQPTDQIITSTYDLVLDAMQIYPNPTTNILNIVGKQINIANANVTFKITDVAGRILYQHYVNQYNGQYQISVDALDAGVYFLTISQSNTALQSKIFIKQ